MADLPELGTERLEFRRDGPVGLLTISNPTRRNALSMAMYRGIGLAIDFVESDPELEALIVTGVDDVFIVGGDVDDHDTGATPLTDDDLPFTRMQTGTIPIVAAINGLCQASGVQLAVLADVAVVSDRATFRLPELRLGVAAPWSAALLPAVVGTAWAKDLALTSRSISADEAMRIGLVSRVVDADALESSALAAALELLEAGPEARLAWKQAVHSAWPVVAAAAVDASIATGEALEGFAAFAGRRPPRWSPGVGKGAASWAPPRPWAGRRKERA